MAGEFSTPGANVALDAATGRVTQTARTTYLALLTAAPTDASTLATMAEVTTAGYARQAITWSAPAGDPAETHNTNVLDFGPFTADPPNVTHYAVVSAASGTTGDLVAHGAWQTPRDGVSGDVCRVAAGDLSLTVD
jgi:hypothetical protein